jgi:hypothetical protein
MSKHKEAPTVEAPTAEQFVEPSELGVSSLGHMLDVASRKAPAELDKVPIGDCVGKMIDCPTCGKPAMVQNARGARTVTQVLSSKWWVMVKCGGFCGSVLHRIALPVSLRPQPEPEPVFKSLGAAVGSMVKCPRVFMRDMGTALERTELCGARAKAAWTLDEGHVIACPECQVQAYPGETLVEVIA